MTQIGVDELLNKSNNNDRMKGGRRGSERNYMENLGINITKMDYIKFPRINKIILKGKRMNGIV